MGEPIKARSLDALKALLAAIPWLLSMYLFYWLDSSGTWTTETPHRGKLSVVILAAGMVASFYLYSFVSRRKRSE